jgi:hypothetical protein
MERMKRRTRSTLLRFCAGAVWSFAAIGVASGATVEGQRFDDALKLDGGHVVLNGTGVRAAAWFKAYVAALYLTQKSNDPDAILAAPGAKRIAVRLLVDANAGLLAKTFADGIRKNYRDEALAALQPRMDAFDAQIRGLPNGARKGEEIDLDFKPNVGTRVLVAGKPIGDVIPGDDFYAALLKMFIGERAVDKSLRAGLLGQAQQ